MDQKIIKEKEKYINMLESNNYASEHINTHLITYPDKLLEPFIKEGYIKDLKDFKKINEILKKLILEDVKGNLSKTNHSDNKIFATVSHEKSKNRSSVDSGRVVYKWESIN